MSAQLFPALLRYWRKRRGQSQLDLALEAGVSARHVSFLESGRARPSSEMALRLLSTLHVPLRAQNEALRAAGLKAHFPEPGDGALEPEVDRALEQMMAQQEPYPMTVLGGDFRILQKNRGASALLEAFVAEPARLPDVTDLLTLFFEPKLLRPFVADWAAFASTLLNRVHRELLQRGGDERLRSLLDRVLTLPDVPKSFRHPDFSALPPAAQHLRLQRDGMNAGFLVTITKFSAPQNVALDELTVESCFPLDDATRATCARLVRRRGDRPKGLKKRRR